jgi:hypothetical protein
VYLDQGLSGEFGAFVGGSGVSAGGELRLRNEFGSSQSATNASTNTMAYHLQDDDGADDFTVAVRRDQVLGSYVFELNETTSQTSCPYEGGYQLDQPELSVGTLGETSMVIDEVPIGAQATFPLIVCNNSTEPRTYHLQFNASTNTEGGVINGFGVVLNGNDDGVQLVVPAGQCLPVANITLTQPSTSVVDFNDIEVYLYSLCDPDIRSTVSITALFGAGNVVHCDVSSEYGTADGDYIDGVQLGDISNLGSGGAGGPHYTDHTDQYTTMLAQNSTHTLTLTSGTYSPNAVAAWIDYNKDGTFDTSEKLGEFTTSMSGETQPIEFTVPGMATLGNSVLRVRGVYVDSGEPSPIDPCFAYAYGETEDYEVSIVSSTGLADQANGGAELCRLAPNPANATVSIISLDPDLFPMEFSIRDHSGRLVHPRQVISSGTVTQVNIEHLPSGPYLVDVSNGQHSRIMKLMVVH